MKSILVIGAGRSSSSVIKYLLQNAENENWRVVVGDLDLELAKSKVEGFGRGEALLFDATSESFVKEEITKADLVISMLPAHMHVGIAEECINQKKHLITPSYVSKEMKALDEKAKDNGVLIMNELGVDPGIDHMSAQKNFG